MAQPDFTKIPNGLTDCTLPVEIIGIIAKQLVADNARGTCAALNLTCQAVHQKTLQALWRVVVQWGARMFEKMPVTFADDVLSGAQEVSRKEAEKEVLEGWTCLINSKGAKHIEYLVIPPFSLDTPAMRLILTKLDPDRTFSLLPRLKAIISVMNCSADGARADANCGGVVHLTSSYRCGSEDIFQLPIALKMFYDEVSDLDLKRFLAKKLFLSLIYNIGQDDTLPIRDRWNYPDHMVTEWQTMLKTCPLPKVLMLPIIEDDDADATKTTIVNVFLDVAYWLSRGEGSVTWELRGSVTLSNVLPEQLTTLARAVQTATIRDPSIALANWEFTSAHLPFTLSARAEIDEVLAISRDIYSLAAKRLNYRVFGEASIRWFTDQNVINEFRVIPSGWESQMTTIARFDGGAGKILHMMSLCSGVEEVSTLSF